MKRLPSLGVLAATALLTACQGDGSASRQLQSITVTDANGQVQSVSRFDYNGNLLERVRAYNQPGPDGVVGTADDPLAGGSYVACEIIPAFSSPLYDPYAEQFTDNRVARLFAPQPGCALPGLTATRVTSTVISGPGPDGQWFTADDAASRRITLARTATGSELQEYLLSAAPCDAACFSSPTPSEPDASGLDNIVYNPYASLGTTGLANVIYRPGTGLVAPAGPPLAIHYTQDAGGRVIAAESAQYLQRTTYDAEGDVTMRELVLPLATDDSNLVLTLFMSPNHFREDYQRLDSGRTAITSYALMEKSLYDVMDASPTGHILLAMLGLGSAGEITEDGLTYVQLHLTRYLADQDGGSVETVRQLAGPGDDGEWFTADDSIAATATLRYASASAPRPAAADGTAASR